MAEAAGEGAKPGDAALAAVDAIDVKRLQLKPGDLLVVRSTEELDQVTADRIRAGIRQLLTNAGHPNTRVMILGPKLSVEVLGVGDSRE